MTKHRRAKGTAPSQALFDVMDGEAPLDASPPAFPLDESAAQVIERTDASLTPIEAAVDAATASVILAREEDAIFGDGTDDATEGDSGAAEDRAVQEPDTVAGRRNREAMDPVALVFLDDAMARRLAVAWPVCEGNEEEWLDAAGFSSKQYAEARRIGRALRLNGICRDGGVTDPMALQYVQAIIARSLPAAAKKKPTKE